MYNDGSTERWVAECIRRRVGDGGGDGVAPPSDAPSAGLAPPLEKVALIYRFTAHF